MKTLLKIVLFLLLLAVFSLYAVMAIRPGDGQGTIRLDAEEPEYIQTFQSTDISALARLFEHTLPVLPNAAVSGTISTERFENKNARLLTLRYPQLTLSCVRPSTAASLLLRPGLTLMNLWTDDSHRFDVLSMPAIYAEKDQQRCLWFSDDSAAYSLYTDELSREAFLALSARLSWY